MSDIKELLDQTARSAEATPPPDVVESDVLRGRAALVRRRRRRAVGSSIGGTVAAAAIVASAIVVGGPDGSSEVPTARPAHPDRVISPDTPEPGVRLVTYTGEQPEAFFVEYVPEGFYLQTSSHPKYELAIAPNGNTTDSDDFVDKLVVTLMSRDWAQELPPWADDPVEVNGEPGVVDYGDAADTLFYRYPDGRYVVVQAWRSTLHWSNEQLVMFAEGITVTEDAKGGIG